MMPDFLDLSASRIPGQIQESLITYMRLFAGLPGMSTYDGADCYWFITGRGPPGDNVLRARWGVTESDESIDGLFHSLSGYISEISWMVFPGDQPADLNQRLEARGYPGGRAGNWLYLDLARLAPQPPVPTGFHIEQVHDDRMMAEWVQVSEAGFQGEFGWFYDAYARHGYGPDAYSLHYTGYLGDIPVTSGTLLDAGGCPALYDISTPAQFRRQGFGGAITHFMLREIVRRDYPYTWIWSSDMARPVYQRLGFVDADFGVREHVWKKDSQDKKD